MSASASPGWRLFYIGVNGEENELGGEDTDSFGALLKRLDQLRHTAVWGRICVYGPSERSPERSRRETEHLAAFGLRFRDDRYPFRARSGGPARG